MKVNCKCCGIEFDKIPSEIKKTKNNYCSRSCAGKENNKNFPKRKKTRKCHSCDSLVSSKYKFCSECKKLFYNVDKTLKEVIYTEHHKSSAYALVRTRARAIAKKLGWNKCSQCGYDKHVEIAHIQAINKFDDNTFISVINHESNLKPLCPNCHWEYDHQKSTG